MDNKTAVDIYDYISDHQGNSIESIGDFFNIEHNEMRKLVVMWASHSRGEFIFLLTKSK